MLSNELFKDFPVASEKIRWKIKKTWRGGIDPPSYQRHPDDITNELLKLIIDEVHIKLK